MSKEGVGTTHIHDGVQLYIKHNKLFAVQISPENLPRIFNMFRDWALRYDVPRSEDTKDPKLTMQKTERGPVLEGRLLDYLVWGPYVELHVVPGDQFMDIYQITEELE